MERLAQLDVQLSVVEGTVLGTAMVQPLRFDPLEPVVIHPLQRFEVLPAEKIRVIGSSPLAHLGPISFASVRPGDPIGQLLELAWREHVKLTKGAIIRARQLARDSQLYLDPWRIEGSLDYNGERIQLLFSSRGDRACVSGINGRPMVQPPRLPRVILAVDPTDDFLETDRKWRVAIEQARACLGPSPQVVAEEGQLSLDIASRDLETSYSEAPEPVRLPPPRAPAPPPKGSSSSAPRGAPSPPRPGGSAVRPMTRPMTRSVTTMTAIPGVVPRPTAEANVSLDLTSDDLP